MEENMDLNSTNAPEGEAREQAGAGGLEASGPDAGGLENVVFENSAAMSVSAQGDANIENSLAMAMVAGKDLAVTNSLGSVYVAGHDLAIQEGGGVVMVVGNQAQVDRSTIGILFAGSEVNLTEGSRILMTGRHALALGVVLGASFALITSLLRRLR